MSRVAAIPDYTHSEPPPLSRYHASMLKLLEKIGDAAIKRGVWHDEPPAVWCVDRTRTTLGLPSLAAQEMPVPEVVWVDAYGDEVMRLIAERLAPVMRERREALHRLAGGGREPIRDIDAVAYCGESWNLQYPDDATDEQIEQAVLFAQARGVADHPWAVEAKTVMAVSADGWCYNVIRRRPTGTGPAVAEPPGGVISGPYPDALAALLAAMRAGA